MRVPIIPETRHAVRDGALGALMDKFEEIGKRLDEELTRLRKYVEEEVAPATEKRTAQVLREAAEKLSEAARKMEARVAARTAQDSSEPKP